MSPPLQHPQIPTLTILRTSTTSDAKPETSDPIPTNAAQAQTAAPQDANKVMKIKRNDDAYLSFFFFPWSGFHLGARQGGRDASHLVFGPSHPGGSQKLGMKHPPLLLLSRRPSRPSRAFLVLKQEERDFLYTEFVLMKWTQGSHVAPPPMAGMPGMGPQVLLGSGEFSSPHSREQALTVV